MIHQERLREEARVKLEAERLQQLRYLLLNSVTGFITMYFRLIKEQEEAELQLIIQQELDRQVEIELQKQFSDNLTKQVCQNSFQNHPITSNFDLDMINKLSIDDASMISENKTITDDSISFTNDIQTVQELQDEESKWLQYMI